MFPRIKRAKESKLYKKDIQENKNAYVVDLESERYKKGFEAGRKCEHKERVETLLKNYLGLKKKVLK